MLAAGAPLRACETLHLRVMRAAACKPRWLAACRPATLASGAGASLGPRWACDTCQEQLGCSLGGRRITGYTVASVTQGRRGTRCLMAVDQTGHTLLGPLLTCWWSLTHGIALHNTGAWRAANVATGWVTNRTPWAALWPPPLPPAGRPTCKVPTWKPLLHPADAPHWASELLPRNRMPNPGWAGLLVQGSSPGRAVRRWSGGPPNVGGAAKPHAPGPTTELQSGS